MTSKLIPLLLAVPLALAAQSAAAQLNTLKFGVAGINVSSKTTGLKGVGVPAGSDIEIGNASTVVFDYERKLNANVSVELALGLPPRHDVTAKGPIAFLGKIASVKQFAPTVFVNYAFGDENAAFRPFVGLGVNYTRFIGARSMLGQNIDLSDSVGLAGQVGFSYAINKQWGICGSFIMAKVESDLVATANTVQTTTIDFRPKVLTLGLSYKF
jgi:outer membrane protein